MNEDMSCIGCTGVSSCAVFVADGLLADVSASSFLGGGRIIVTTGRSLKVMDEIGRVTFQLNQAPLMTNVEFGDRLLAVQRAGFSDACIIS